MNKKGTPARSPWGEDIRKGPPIPNPMKAREREAHLGKFPNDDMSENQVFSLFENVIDPMIKRADAGGRRRGKNYKGGAGVDVVVPLKELQMSYEVAEKWLNKMYPDYEIMRDDNRFSSQERRRVKKPKKSGYGFPEEEGFTYEYEYVNEKNPNFGSLIMRLGKTSLGR